MSATRTGLVLLLLFLGRPAHAQVILSFEGLDRSAGEGFYAQVQVSVNGNTGNADYLDLGLQGGVGHRPLAAPGHWWRFYPAYWLRRSEGTTVVHERSAHFRHSYLFSEVMRTYAFVQIQADQSVDLDRRFLVGGGLRRRIVALKGGGLDIGLGLMLEDELLASGQTETRVRGANLLAADGHAGIVELSASGFFQPALSEFADHRVSVVVAATLPVSEHVELGISGYWRRDSRPPTDIEIDDAGIRLVMRFTAD